MAKIHNFYLLTCLVVMIPTLYANVKEDEAYWKRQSEVLLVDSYWQERASIAEKENQQAYTSDPYSLTKNLTFSVSEIIIGEKNGRRNLRGRGGKCMATNPIDRCWRCDPNWANNRKKLADCVQGFGRNTIGGKNGPFYVVNSSLDNDMVNPAPGTLRHAVTRSGPLWIIFARSMNIRLSQELIMTSDKTIDGRGVDVYIANGAGITIQFIKNVIIHGIKIFNIQVGNGGLIRDSETHYGFRTYSDGDGISIFGSSNVWIDHVSMRNCKDGLIDAIQGSTAITISNGHFTDHNEVMLFGASDSYDGDKIMQITLAFNHFGKRLVQRMPRCRYGFVHVVNNDYTHWEMYAIGGSKHPTIISEGNRFIAPNNVYAKEITKREYSPEQEWKNWQWRSINDEYMNGAFFREGGSQITDRPFSRQDMITAKPGSYVGRLTRYAGSLRCIVGKPC
ncbi:putative pectate lyase 3 [Glycine soja]|uniref:Pectate lyase n=1 Tax=Glycine soja TaxID=3848 RepID=A0A445LYS2_GLYSO|nr:probable pectate lyase 3 [Glycine soja]KAH1264495.1 putative pectate lyase 3 [Glycine max]RZC28425.1 putative pectate lyase 3 [Glycine soja]